MDVDLSVAIATWVAAAISAAGAGIVLWVRARDRPLAVWNFALEAYAGRMGVDAIPPALIRDGRLPYRFVRVTNAGDGDAYAVSVAAVGETDVAICEMGRGDLRGASILETAARVAPGESFLIVIWLLATMTPGQPVQIDGDLGVRVEWTQGPVRHERHYAQTLRLVGSTPGPQTPLRLEARSELTGFARTLRPLSSRSHRRHERRERRSERAGQGATR